MGLSQFLVTSEDTEAIAALEMVSEALTGAEHDRYRWKWAIIALHSALQGYMVLALRGMDGYEVLSPKAAKAYLEARRSGNPMPGEQLDTYLNLYKKIKSDRMLIWGPSRKFKPCGTQGRSVKKLNSLRNNFVHFLPQGYALQITMLPEIFRDCLDVVEFLGGASNNVHWLDDRLEERSLAALSAARSAIERVEATIPSS